MNRRHLPLAWTSLTLVLLGLMLPGTSSAQRAGGQRFVPNGSEGGVLGTRDAFPRQPLKPYASLWLHYALDPVVVLDLEGEEIGPLVEHLLAADLVASMNLWKGLEVGVGLPLTLVQTGDDVAAMQSGVAAGSGAALGDVELRVGYRLQLSHNLGVALHVPVLLPTGGDELLALGFGVRPTLALSAALDGFDLLFNLGYLVRGRIQTADYRGGDELTASVGARVGLDSTWNTALLAEIGMASGVRDFFSAAGTPMEGRLGGEYWFLPKWRFTAFAGTGFTTGVGAPDLRLGVGVAFGEKLRRPHITPLPGDRDADGIRDEDDACPDDPEDKDGFEDEDGCPDLDNDKDGLLDVDDECPNEPETHDGIADDDGCPDHIRVEGTLITTFEAVKFKTGSDEILEESHPMLTEVSRVLEANPDMRLSVEGHTDSVGDEGFNRELSQRRADSVRRFIVSKGVDDGRVESKGYGESRPVADNETHKGRRQNRRVEFHIVR